ncbi:hypothetical protein [Clostridium transplantifaecale]|uniref:hypothetical protein n=1 Tax=Clostridium transplantifaecale TaxID=2479838 RepID=UPI000F63EC20|nr:hypothetical protein [Clostridium transplantifaecale]
MRGNENAAGTAGVRDGEGEIVSLQSRLVGCGEGESRRKNSYGDPLPLVERTADAKTSKNAV